LRQYFYRSQSIFLVNELLRMVHMSIFPIKE
jgi:hypothetical protein